MRGRRELYGMAEARRLVPKTRNFSELATGIMRFEAYSARRFCNACPDRRRRTQWARGKPTSPGGSGRKSRGGACPLARLARLSRV